MYTLLEVYMMIIRIREMKDTVNKMTIECFYDKYSNYLMFLFMQSLNFNEFSKLS